MQTTSTKRRQSSENASSPLSSQSLTLLGKWLECAPKDRLCSILKKLCEEQAIAHEVFNAMTVRDIEIAEAELTDIISEKDESTRDGNAGGVRGDLAIPRGLQQKEIADTGTKTGSVARKRKTKQHSSDDEESDEDVYDSNHPREAVHKRVKIGDGAIILKRRRESKTSRPSRLLAANMNTARWLSVRIATRRTTSVSRTRFASIILVGTYAMSFLPDDQVPLT